MRCRCTTYILLIPALFLLVAGCDKPAKPEAANTTTNQPPAVSDSEPPNTVNPGPPEAADNPATEQPGQTKPQPSEHQAADDDEDPVERPKPRPMRPGDIVSAETKFKRAEYNTDENATLSHLYFEFRSNLGRMSGDTVEISMNEYRETVCGELDMGLCRIEIYPAVEKPIETGRSPKGGTSFRVDGAYQVWVYQPADELIGIFAINTQGHFMSAPPDKSPEGYGVRARRHIDDYGPVPYTIYKNDPDTGQTDYLLTVQYSEGTLDTVEVESENYSTIEYRFPNGLLEFYTPQIGKRDE